jgi:hypothetical protein
VPAAFVAATTGHLAHSDQPALLLHFGQALNALTLLMVYAAGRVLLRSREGGLFAAVLARDGGMAGDAPRRPPPLRAVVAGHRRGVAVRAEIGARARWRADAFRLTLLRSMENGWPERKSPPSTRS